MATFKSNSFFLMKPREGNAFEILEDKQISLSNVSTLLNSKDTQIDCLKDLGITISNQILNVQFKETGCEYLDPKGDRSKASPTTSIDTFKLRLPLVTEIYPPLCIEILIEPFVEEGVSFLGKLEFCMLNGVKRTVPLTGFGTTALEGQSNDCHAGFCTGPSCALFQQRCAILLSVAMAAGVKEDNFDLLTLRLQNVNEKFHGRKDILDYTVLCVKGNFNSLTYLEYMKQKYVSPPNASGHVEFKNNTPPMLRSYLEETGPVEGYYTKLEQSFSAEDIESEKRVWLKATSRRHSSKLNRNGVAAVGSLKTYGVAFVLVAIAVVCFAIKLKAN